MKAFKKLAAFMSAAMLVTSVGVPGVSAAADKYSNLYLESLYFTNEDNLVMFEPDGKQDIYPNVCIQKDESAAPFEGSIIVAVYKDGALLSLNSFDAEDSYLTGETVFGFDRSVFRGPQMDMPEGSNAKVFFWESEESMIPYDEPAEAVPGFEDQYYGKLTFPEPFASLVSGFDIVKEPGVRNYSNTATPYNVYDWSDATEIFLSTDVNYLGSGVAERLGTDRNAPITGRNFAAQYKAGAYKKEDGSKQTKFIFTLLNDFYSGTKSASGQNVHSIPVNNFSLNDALKLGEGEAIDALIRSGSESGFTWMGTMIKQDDASWITQQWTPVDGHENVYSTVKNSSEKVLTLFNFENLDAYGMPRPYVLVNSIEEVAATEGTFFAETNNKIYCHPRSGENLSDIDLVAEDSFLSGLRHAGAYSVNTIMFENIGFAPRITAHNNNVFYGMDYDKAIYGFFGCKFSGGASNTIVLDGRYTCYMVDSIAAYGFRDGFNYHGMQNDKPTIDTDGRSSTVIELNCIAYMVGDFNRITNSEEIDHVGGENKVRTDNSNNASTVHDNMKCLRIGARYWGTQGPIIGDGAYEVTMGTEAYDITPTPSDKIAFGITSDLLNSYVIDCYATGTNIRSGVNANDTSYILDYCGNSRITKGGSGNLFEPENVITWDDISKGIWHTIKTMTVEGLKTEYSVGENLDLTNAKLVITYDDGAEAKEIPLTDSSIMVTGFDSSEAGEKTLTVTYKSLAEKVDISIVERDIETIELSGIKTDYSVGESFDAETGVLFVNYADGTSENIALSSPNVIVSGFDTATAGTKTITVTFRDKSVTAEINVAERILTGFTLEGLRTEYALNEAFDTATGKIIASYDNGTTAEIALSADGVEIEGFDTATAGKKTVTVTYMGYSQNYEINVVEKLYEKHYNIMEDMSDTQGHKSWYYRYYDHNTKSFAEYKSGTAGIWNKNGSGANYDAGQIRMVSNNNVLEAGNAGDSALTFKAPAGGTIKISMAKGVNAQQDIIYEAGSADISRFKILKNNEQIYPLPESGEEWLVLTAANGNYNAANGTNYPNKVTFAPMTIDIREGDEIIFRVNKGGYGSKAECGFSNDGDKVCCVPQIDYIEPAENPELTGISVSGVKTEYKVGESIDRSSGSVVLKYDNAADGKVSFADEGVTVEGFDTSSTGKKTVTVSYAGFSTAYEINVTEEVVEVKEVYNALDDMSENQGENSWYYKYAPIGKFGLSDYLEFDAYDTGKWTSKTDGVAFGRIRQNQWEQSLDAGVAGDSALTFKAPADGTIEISMLNNIIRELESQDINRFKIYKNDEKIFPAGEEEWLILAGPASPYKEQYPTEITFAPISADVSKGDLIIFRVNKGVDSQDQSQFNNQGDKMMCTPIIKYTSQGGTDPDPLPGIEGATVKKVFNFGEDFSDTQGENNWYYLHASRNTNDYAEMPLYEKYAYYSAIGWKAASNSYAYGIINNNYMSSGHDQDPVLGFRAPIGGTITISIPNGLKDAGQGSENSDGVNFNIYKASADGERTKLFPAGEDEFYDVPRTLGSETVTPFEPVSVDVEAGDYIYFRVNMKANSANDNLFYNPIIEYTSDIGVYLNDAYVMLDIEDGTPVGRILSYTGTADSVSFESSDEEVVTAAADGTITPVAPGSAYVTLSAAVGENVYKTSVLVDVVNKKNPTPFADGDVIGMWGDSLTHGGNYAERIEEFYASKYPDMKIDIPKFGYSGDNTVDIINRIERDMKTRTDITRATILIGANDFALDPSKIGEGQETYTDRMNTIIKAFKDNGITDITLITPTPFDAVRSGNNLRAGLMEEFSYDLRKIASDNDCAIVDSWTVMDAYDAKLKEGHEVSPAMPSLMSDDNLHPSDQGYMVLAYSILKAQGVLLTDADAPGVEINAADMSANNVNSTVEGLSGDAEGFSFNYTPDTLAYPKNTGYNEFAELEETLSDEFAEGDILKVSGLDSDAEYDISIDNQTAATVTGAELLNGVNLSGLDGALKAKSDKLTEIVDLMDNYDDNLVNILNTEWRYLGATDVLSVEEGIALADKMVAEGKLNEGTANSYKTLKNLEESSKTKLAAEWDNLYNAASDRTVSISVTKKGASEPIGDHYNIMEDLSSTQGQNAWYYRYWNHNAKKYEEYNKYNNYTWNTNGGNANGQIRIQPGNQVLEAGSNGDSSLTFKAPKSGKITITMAKGTAAEENIIKEGGSSDISRFRIMKNEEQIYPLPETGEEWLVLVAADGTRVVGGAPAEDYNDEFGTDYPSRVTFEPITIEVSEGDEIIFQVNKGGYGTKAECGFNNDGDKVTCVPQIDYVSE